MKQPLVSVITVTRNRGFLLGRCIQSVLGQTYQNVEHIVVDGASTDNTKEVIDSFNDPRLKFFGLEENLPVLETIDLAFEQSKGDYICFLDSDDEYCLDKVEKELCLIQSLPEEYGMVYCWMTYFDSSANNKVIRVHKPELRGFVPDKNMAEPVVSGTPTYMFKRETFKKLGGWNKELPCFSDWELAARCTQICAIDYVPESLVNVYENHGSLRQTDEILRHKAFFSKRVGMHKYMLNEFKENFERCPRRKCSHYSRIILYAFKDKQFFTALNYTFKYIFCKLFGI